MTADNVESKPKPPKRPGFAVNTLWTWASVITSFAMAIFVSRLMVRRLGDEVYGLWSLVFTIVEYYGLLDLGIRSAVVKYVAQHWTLGEDEQLSRTLNTAFAYFLAISVVLFALTITMAPLTTRIFPFISPELQPSFVYVVIITGCTWAIGLIFVCISSSLDAAQRFDITSRIAISVSVVRLIGIVGMLQLGYGLKAVVTVAVLVRLAQFGFLYRAFVRQFPAFRWNMAHVDRAVFRRLLGFSVHTLPAAFGSVLIDQGPAVAIGNVQPAQYVGYFNNPRRLVQAVQDFVFRLGIVTTARTAELVAHGRREALIRLGVQANRYAFTIFMAAAVFFIVYATPIIALLMTPDFAKMSAPLLPVFTIGVLFSDAIQFNSSSMLYGMARHQVYSALRMLEGILSTACVYYFARQGDLWSGVVAITALMIVNRGIVTPILLCRELRYPVLKYLSEIVVLPLSAGLAVAGIMWLVRMAWTPATIPELIAAGALSTSLYGLLAGRLCFLPEHHSRILDLVRRKAPSFEKYARLWLGAKTVETTG
jgi:O-antigen/teichoic acid export membrane protein